MSKDRTLIVNELHRFPEDSPQDHLAFQEGVNVIVGPPNTGKSKWFQMLDYLLGDNESASEAFGEDLANKYTSMKARMTVAGEAWEVERRWDEGTPKSRVFLNGEAINVTEYRHRLLSQLEIPILHYPQGNPYGQRTWPELGWRSLYRHMYRQQLLWSDIADKQPESEQHACILQFVGLAKHLYSKEYGELVEKEKKIIELKAQKEQFMTVLSDVSKELLSAEEIGVGVTPQSLNSAKQRLELRIDELSKERHDFISSLTKEVLGHSDAEVDSANMLDKLAEEIAHLESQLERILLARERNQDRLSDMQSYRASIEQEVERLRRAQKAGSVLADLKVTHCPACDRPVAKQQDSDANCFLCHQPLDETTTHGSGQRLEMEVEQAKAVLAEGDEMIAVLQKDRERIETEVDKIETRIRERRNLLMPVRSAAAAVLPPEIGVIERRIGQLQEQLSQLERISKSMDYRELLAKQIDSIQIETVKLEREVARQGSELDFERASDSLEDAMNTYLNAIKQASPTSWTHKRVRVRIDEKRTRFLIGDQKKWNTQLGGTLTLYFLIGYHYALMNLSNDIQCNFPGFLALDFPAELPDGSSIKDKENFVIDPFVKLLATDDFPKCQVIAAGNSFESLVGAHRIEFSKVWT